MEGFLVIINCRSTMTIKEVTIVAGTDLWTIPIINGHRDKMVHTATVIRAVGIHV